MDKDRCFKFEGPEDVPVALVMVAFVSLWSFVATAVSIYCSTLSQF